MRLLDRLGCRVVPDRGLAHPVAVVERTSLLVQNDVPIHHRLAPVVQAVQQLSSVVAPSIDLVGKI